MDQSTKSIPPHNPASRQDSSRFAGPKRRHPSQATVRAVHVVVSGVRGQHSLQLPTSKDQQPSSSSRRTVPTQRSAEAFARGARTGVASTPIPSAATAASNAAVNLVSRSQTTNRNWPTRPARAMSRLRPAGPPTPPDGMGRDPQQVDPAGHHLDRQQHAQPPQQDRLHGEQVHRQHTGSLRPEELPPGERRPHRRRSNPGTPQDHPTRCWPDPVLVAKPAQLAVDAAIPPGGVLPASRSTNARTPAATAGRPRRCG
jgi:hypothetical protein